MGLRGVLPSFAQTEEPEVHPGLIAKEVWLPPAGGGGASSPCHHQKRKKPIVFRIPPAAKIIESGETRLQKLVGV